jgi:2-desacetyl-2-hydroxyethyl bacteriochlorophyllide A dehydrogenase
MKQVLLERPGCFVASDVVPPVAGTGEALLRVHRVGICGTDYHAFHGRQPFFAYPRVIGHELGAEVVSAPPNARGITAGDRCTVEPYLNCGKCSPCRSGRYNNCEDIKVVGVHTDGGLRELLSVPVDHVYRSSRLGFDQLALVEPLSIGAQAVMRSGLRTGELVLVIGAGPIGVAVTQLALAAGARVCVLETAANRRAQVERLGVKALKAFDGVWADVVIDATGNPASMAQAFSKARFGGRIVWVGIVPGAVPLEDPLFHHRELTLLASRNSAGHFPTIIRMIEEGIIDTSPWITHRLSLDEVPRRFEEIGQCERLKVMVGID